MSGNRKNGKSESFQKIYSGEIPRINFSDFLIFRFFLNSACGIDSHNKFLNPFRGAPSKLLSPAAVRRVLCRLRLAAVACVHDSAACKRVCRSGVQRRALIYPTR